MTCIITIVDVKNKYYKINLGTCQPIPCTNSHITRVATFFASETSTFHGGLQKYFQFDENSNKSSISNRRKKNKPHDTDKR